jgi:hypothetical protein
MIMMMMMMLLLMHKKGTADGFESTAHRRSNGGDKVCELVTTMGAGAVCAG